MIFKFSNGKITEMKPIAGDNPKSVYNFEDRSILRKATKWAKMLSKDNDDLECRVEHYEHD